MTPNPKIKELIKSPGIIPEDEHYEVAELIAKECMRQIEEVKQIKTGNAGPEYTQGFDDGMFVAIRTIEEHFGVE